MSQATHAERHPVAAVIALATVLFMALSMAMPTAAFADYGEDERFSIIDRSDDSRIAYAHSDHWHGSLPTVPVDDHISLGAEILDEDGAELALDGSPYEFGVALADGADDIVDLTLHGDHVHIAGEAEGESEVVFQLLSDGDVEWESPGMAVTVSGDADHGHDDDDDHGHSHDDDHDHDDAPEGGVDAGFGGAAGPSGMSLTTVLLAGMVLFALLAAAVALRPAGARR